MKSRGGTGDVKEANFSALETRDEAEWEAEEQGPGVWLRGLGGGQGGSN